MATRLCNSIFSAVCLCIHTYICMPMCACVCAPVRVTYAPQNGMREKWALKEQRKEQVLITWQHRNESARVVLQRNERNETKRNGRWERRGVDWKVKAKAKVLQPLEWNKPATPAKPSQPQQKQ